MIVITKKHKIFNVASFLILNLVLSVVSAFGQNWSSWAGNSARQSVWTGVPSVAHQTYWSIKLDDVLNETGWSPVGPGSPVIYDNTIFVYAQKGSGFSADEGAIIALDSRTGALQWKTLVGAPQMGSWASPTLDISTGSIIIGSGERSVKCLNASDGSLRWNVTLEKSVVNATAAVGSGKVYITDYDGFGTSGILYAINNNPNDNIPDGTIDWQYKIGGASGSTPTYHNGVVYVGSINDGSGGSGWPNARGQIYAFDAYSGTKKWQIALPNDSSAGNPFGGLAYYDGKLYVGTYEFYGNDESAGLYSIDAADGSVEMSTLANRSDTIPLVWQRDDGSKIVIYSGGIEGYGTHQELQFFDENSGDLLGKSSIESDGKGWIGNWTYEPAIINDILYIGGETEGWFGPSNHLWAIDLDTIDWDSAQSNPFTLTPTSSAVIADLGPGSSPAYFTDGTHGFLATYGPGGRVVVYGVPEPITLIFGILGGFGFLFIRKNKRTKFL